MADTATGRVALFSIKPQYAAAILDGSKEVEFRRTSLASDVSHVVIYATSPVQKVIGTFEVAGVESAVPDELWDSYSAVGGIARDDYTKYFAGTDTGYAIKVRSPRLLNTPLRLNDLSPGLRPPQSYQYLQGDALAKMQRLLGPFGRQGWLDDLGGRIVGIVGRPAAHVLPLGKIRGRVPR